MLDVTRMLRELAEDGWNPVLHQAVQAPSRLQPGWACYPQAEVAHFFIGRAPDPGTAVLALYEHARAHPRVRRPFTAAVSTPSAPDVAPYTPTVPASRWTAP